MITPFLIKMNNNQYIFLKENIVELHNEFPFEGNLELLEKADEYRQLVQQINLNMISIIFVNGCDLPNIENRFFELLENGTSSVLKVIIDSDDQAEYETVYRNIQNLKHKLIEFRGINYGLVLFYIRIKNLDNLLNLNLDHVDQNISIINYNYDQNIIVSNSFCNWVLCGKSKYISKFYKDNPNANYIFDLSEMLQANQIEEMANIIKIIKTQFKKQKVRLFPLSINRLFLHHDLDTYCSCKNGISICYIENSQNVFSCYSKGVGNMLNAECSYCALKDLCGSCVTGIAADKSCSIKKLFSAYYSDLLHRAVDFC